MKGVEQPAEAAVAGLVVPAAGEPVKDVLRELDPLRLVAGRIGELALGGEHGRHAPDAVVVVGHGVGEVDGQVVPVVAGLVQHAAHDEVVAAAVAGEVPVLDQRGEDGRAVPPVVRGVYDARDLAFVVAVVEGEDVGGDLLGAGLDLVYREYRSDAILRRGRRGGKEDTMVFYTVLVYSFAIYSPSEPTESLSIDEPPAFVVAAAAMRPRSTPALTAEVENFMMVAQLRKVHTKQEEERMYGSWKNACKKKKVIILEPGKTTYT